MFATSALLTALVVPGFVAGSAAPQIRADFPLDPGAIGLIFGGFWGAIGVASAPAARVTERLGPTASARLAAVLSASASLLAAATAGSALALGLILVVAGLAVAVAEPALNTLLARHVSSERQGRAFAVKQSGLPAGLILTGLAVPLLADPFGWRWLLVLAAVLAVVCAALLPPAAAGERAHERPPSVRLDRGPLMLLALGSGLGTAAIGAHNAFFVVASPEAGLSPTVAVVLLAVGSGLTIAIRLVVGFRADRRSGGHIQTIAAMIGSGVLGFALLVLGGAAATLVGGLLVITFVWGWMGLLSFAVVRHYPDAPGRATGFVQTGLFLGTLIGPVVFGQIAEATSFTVAWSSAGLWACLAAALFLLAGRALVRTGRAPRSDQ